MGRRWELEDDEARAEYMIFVWDRIRHLYRCVNMMKLEQPLIRRPQEVFCGLLEGGPCLNYSKLHL